MPRKAMPWKKSNESNKNVKKEERKWKKIKF